MKQTDRRQCLLGEAHPKRLRRKPSQRKVCAASAEISAAALPTGECSAAMPSSSKLNSELCISVKAFRRSEIRRLLKQKIDVRFRDAVRSGFNRLSAGVEQGLCEWCGNSDTGTAKADSLRVAGAEAMLSSVSLSAAAFGSSPNRYPE